MQGIIVDGSNKWLFAAMEAAVQIAQFLAFKEKELVKKMRDGAMKRTPIPRLIIFYISSGANFSQIGGGISVLQKCTTWKSSDLFKKMVLSGLIEG